MKLREPATFWTDCGLAAWSAWLGFALARGAPSPCPTIIVWWIGGFGASALAAVAGAVHHGLGHTLAPKVNHACWHLALLGLVATGFCLFRVAAHLTFTGPVLAAAGYLAFAVAAGFAFATLRLGRFSVAISAYGSGQLLVLVAALFARQSLPSTHLTWLTAAVATSALAATVQHTRIGLGRHFNHNDVYHVIQFAAQGFFYLGAATLH